MLKKIISTVLAFVFCANPLCFAAQKFDLKQLPPVSSMTQKEKVELMKDMMSKFAYYDQSPREEHLDEVLEVMSVYFSNYDYNDENSNLLGKEIIHSYVYNHPFDYEVMKTKLKDKNTDIEVIQMYAKIPPQDVKIWEEALSLGYYKYVGKCSTIYKEFVEISKLLNESGIFTQEQKDEIFKRGIYYQDIVLVVKKALNDMQIPDDQKFDKIIKTLDSMDKRKNNFLTTIDEKNTEKQLRQNFNRQSENYRESYNIYNKNQEAEKYYKLETMKIFFARFPASDNMTLDEFMKINQLGDTLSSFVKANNYEFIKSRLQKPDTNLKNLSNVLFLVSFDTKPSEEFEKAFDKGYIQSILNSLPTYKNYKGDSYQNRIEISELKDYIAFADSLEENQSFNNEQINEVLSFELNIEYKTKIVKKIDANQEFTQEKKHETIKKKMQKEAKSLERNQDIGKTIYHIVLFEPFMLILNLIPPIPWSYYGYTENVLSDIKNIGFKKPYVVVETIFLGIAALSPFNMPVLIDALKHPD